MNPGVEEAANQDERRQQVQGGEEEMALKHLAPICDQVLDAYAEEPRGGSHVQTSIP